VAAHTGAGAEGQVAYVGTENRTTPVEAGAACVEDRATAVVAVAGNNELQRRVKSACGIIFAP